MAQDNIAAILGWLRAGYPSGVPESDRFPLLALMRRTVTDEEFAAIVDSLDAADGAPTMSDVRDAAERVLAEPPSEDAVRQVAARLVAAGWPIAPSAPQTARIDEVASDRRSVVARVLEWLRVGYPDGVPASEFVPLFALLRRRLTDDEVVEVADALVAAAGENVEIARVEAQIAISKVVDALPSESDIRRVGERLGEAGITLN